MGLAPCLTGPEVFHDAEADPDADAYAQAAQEEGQAEGVFRLGDVG